MLKLEGRPATLDQLDAALPPRRPDGYSISELARASSALGLPLDGKRYRRTDRPLDRPALAYFRDAKTGHFALLRPVGTTGTMVQIIDPPHAPRIVDYPQLFDAKTWRDRILIPREPWAIRHALALATGLAGVLLLGVAARGRMRAKAVTSGPTGAAG